MHITCPSCETVFSVPDEALRPAGRRLKCSQCTYIWFYEVQEEEPEDGGADIDVPVIQSEPVANVGIGTYSLSNLPLEEDVVTETKKEESPRATQDARFNQDAVAKLAGTDYKILPVHAVKEVSPLSSPESSSGRFFVSKVATALSFCFILLLLLILMRPFIALHLPGVKASLAQMGIYKPEGVILKDIALSSGEWQGKQILWVKGTLYNPASFAEPIEQVEITARDVDGKAVYAHIIRTDNNEHVGPLGAIPFQAPLSGMPDTAVTLQVVLNTGNPLEVILR